MNSLISHYKSQPCISLTSYALLAPSDSKLTSVSRIIEQKLCAKFNQFRLCSLMIPLMHGKTVKCFTFSTNQKSPFYTIICCRLLSTLVVGFSLRLNFSCAGEYSLNQFRRHLDGTTKTRLSWLIRTHYS